MDRYTKGFVVASLVYFFLAAVLGIWMGGADAAGWVKSAHVPFNLLGFMSMMIYGVGYFILPRFNGRTLRWPSWVPIHFFVANIGLLGMVGTAPSLPSMGFVFFSALSVISAGMFAVNLGATMLLEPKAEDEPASAAEDASPGAASQAAAGACPAVDRYRHARGRDPHPLAGNRGGLRGARLRLPGEPGAPGAGKADPDHAADGVPAAQRRPRLHAVRAERGGPSRLRCKSPTPSRRFRSYGGQARDREEGETGRAEGGRDDRGGPYPRGDPRGVPRDGEGVPEILRRRLLLLPGPGDGVGEAEGDDA